MSQNGKSTPSVGWTAAVSVAAVVLADFLFYGHPAGWTLGLYAFLLMGVLICQDRGKWFTTRPGIVTTSATFALILSLLYQPGTVGIVLTVLGLMTLGLGARCGWTHNSWEWAYRWLHLTAAGWLQLFRDIGQKARGQPAVTETSKGFGGLLVMLSPIVILAAVFIGLFSMANPVIAQWLETLWETFRELLANVEFPHAGRVALWVLVAVFAWALIRYRTPALQFKMPEASKEAKELGELFLNPFSLEKVLKGNFRNWRGWTWRRQQLSKILYDTKK